MAKPNHPVAIQGALPHWAVLRPALGSLEQARSEAPRDPPVMRHNGQVDVDESVGCGDPLPNRRQTPITVDNPFVLAQDLAMDRHILSSGTLPPSLSSGRYLPQRTWMMSRTYSGSPVISASRLDSVDLPPPALPKTATFFIDISLASARAPRANKVPRPTARGVSQCDIERSASLALACSFEQIVW
jgi:hypothetical protein